MDNKNYKKYIDVLNSNEQIDKKDEFLTLSLTDETLKKLKEIKKSMEWKTDLALNSVLTFFFNVAHYKNRDNIQLSSNQKVQEIRFSPTIKNEKRIHKYLTENTHSSVIELSINLFYQTLIASNTHE